MKLAWLLVLPLALAACASPAGPGDSPAAYQPYNESPPVGARLVSPLLPQSMRHFALSADRMRVAYTAEGSSPYELYAATLGGEAKRLATVDPNIRDLRWTADGKALLYLEPNLAAQDPFAERLMRLPLDGGEPELLIASPTGLRLGPTTARNEVFLFRGRTTANGPENKVYRLDLGTRQETELGDGGSVSPDGDRYLATSTDGATQLVDAATGARKDLGATPRGPVAWTAEDVVFVEHAGTGLKVQRFPFTGPAGEPKTHPLDGSPQLEMISPDGHRIFAYLNNRNVVISLDTGEVKTLDSFGFVRGWLDDKTLMGAYRGGQYAVSVPD